MKYISFMSIEFLLTCHHAILFAPPLLCMVWTSWYAVWSLLLRLLDGYFAGRDNPTPDHFYYYCFHIVISYLLVYIDLFCDAFNTLTGLMFLGAHLNLISYLLQFVGSLGLTSLTLLYCYDICRGLGSKVSL